MARELGVSSFWIEDCVQEVEIWCWQHPEQSELRIAIKRRIVDWLRKYGVVTRSGAIRGGLSLEQSCMLLEEPIDRIISIEQCMDRIAAINSMTNEQQAILLHLQPAPAWRLHEVRKIAKKRAA